jgi:hypothetical protein
MSAGPAISHLRLQFTPVFFAWISSMGPLRNADYWSAVPFAGLPTQVVNDKGRYRQHRAIAISQTSQATTASKSFALRESSGRMNRVGTEFHPP